MDSSYFGLMGNSERGSGGSSASCSSRKGKKSNSISEKPKQPQRGLGVAQLEKLRLHAQIPSAYHHHHHHPPLHHNVQEEDPRILQMPYSTAMPLVPSSLHAFQSHITMGLPEYERTNIIYGDSLPTNARRWEWNHDNNTIMDADQSNITRPFLNLYDSQDIDIKKQRSGSLGSNSQNSESSDTHQVLDLELRLSL